MRPIKNPDIDMPADPFAETQPDLASNATRIRDIVCIVANFDPHPDEDSEQGDDYGHCHECKAVIELEPGDEWTPFCNDCAHAIVEELARAVQEQRIAIRRAESERDAQHAEVLRLTGELQQSRKESLERARTVLMLDEDFDEACALGFGLGCMLTNAQWRESDAVERAQRGLKLMQSCLQDEGRRVSELTATRDLLTAENARLRKERDAALRQRRRLYTTRSS